LSKDKTDKSKRHKDGSGYHHPMGVFPIEVQHLACSRYFPFAFSPDLDQARMASERVG
jgi:hypothetical protein